VTDNLQHSIIQDSHVSASWPKFCKQQSVLSESTK